MLYYDLTDAHSVSSKTAGTPEGEGHDEDGDSSAGSTRGDSVISSSNQEQTKLPNANGRSGNANTPSTPSE